MTVMTIVWGCGFVAEMCVRATLAFSIPVSRFLVVGPIIGYGTIGLLMCGRCFMRGARHRVTAQMPWGASSRTREATLSAAFDNTSLFSRGTEV